MIHHLSREPRVQRLNQRCVFGDVAQLSACFESRVAYFNPSRFRASLYLRQTWHVFTVNEKVFRGRENKKYDKKSSLEYRWYEIVYARSLNVATRSNKLLLQTNATSSEIAVDTLGVLFAGSGTHNAYGLALSNLLDARYCAGLFSADPTNFQVKLISSVFGGGYYSFGDQFIKGLPIPEASKKQHDAIVQTVDSLTTQAATTRTLEQDIAAFPDSVTAQKRNAGKVPDLDTLENLLSSIGGLTNEIRFDEKASIAKDLMGEWVLTIPRGRNASTEFRSNHKTLLEMVAATLEQRRKILRSDFLALRIPEKENDQKKYLQTLHDWKVKLENTKAEIFKLEAELNDIVYSIFKLTAQDRKVIESFLARF